MNVSRFCFPKLYIFCISVSRHQKKLTSRFLMTIHFDKAVQFVKRVLVAWSCTSEHTSYDARYHPLKQQRENYLPNTFGQSRLLRTTDACQPMMLKFISFKGSFFEEPLPMKLIEEYFDTFQACLNTKLFSLTEVIKKF